MLQRQRSWRQRLQLKSDEICFKLKNILQSIVCSCSTHSAAVRNVSAIYQLASRQYEQQRENITGLCPPDCPRTLASYSHHPDSFCSFQQTRQTRGQRQSLFHIIRPINNLHLNAEEIKIELITATCMSKSGKQISYQRPNPYSLFWPHSDTLHCQPGNFQFGAQLKLGRLLSAARTRLRSSRRRIV